MNYKQVIEDFNNGTLDREKVTLVMDNDGGYWLYYDEALEEDKCDDIAGELAKKYGKPEGYNDIVDVLNAAGVNCEWC